jgi:group I intron endonuclease
MKHNLKTSPGVYAIYLLETAQVYVGSSFNTKKRWNLHVCLLRKGIHQNPDLQYYWNTYGEDKMMVLLLEDCKEELLIERETHWFNHYKLEQQSLNCINLRLPHNCKPSTKSIRVYNSKFAVITIDVKSGEVLEHETASHAARYFNTKQNRVTTILSNWDTLKSRGTHRGQIFIHKDNYDPEIDYIALYNTPLPRKNPVYKKIRVKKEKAKKEPIPYAERNLTRKAIKLVHQETGEELHFPSQAEAVRTLKLISSKVTQAIKYPETRSHHGYKFYYV